MTLKKFNVNILRFDLGQGVEKGEAFVLPVDSPDEEHAISAAMSNCIAFTTKVRFGSTLPIAFTCTGISERE